MFAKLKGNIMYILIAFLIVLICLLFSFFLVFPLDDTEEISVETTEFTVEYYTCYETTAETTTEETTINETYYEFYGYLLSEEDVYNIARITYLESGFQGEEYYYTTYLTACVILNRLVDWDYTNINEVIWATGQYTSADMYTTWGGGELNINETTWKAVYEAIANPIREVHYQASNNHLEGTGKTLYYTDGITQIYY